VYKGPRPFLSFIRAPPKRGGWRDG
jgi:hypothetical protein